MATLIGRSEAARILGCSEKSVGNLVKAGKLKPSISFSGKMKFSREELLAMVEKGGELTKNQNS